MAINQFIFIFCNKITQKIFFPLNKFLKYFSFKILDKYFWYLIIESINNKKIKCFLIDIN